MKGLRSSNTDTSQVFKDFIKTSKKGMLIKEQKLRFHEDRIIMMDTSTMTAKQGDYIEQRRVEIMQRR